jgi:iron complex outermembrane recepter protein
MWIRGPWTHGSWLASTTLNTWLQRGIKGCCLIFAAAVVFCGSAWTQEIPKDLGNSSIEDLMNIEVTSVSKKEQKLSATASAVFVITTEDIRRSGATNIPDLLRIVPGMNVAQINANTWAISSRGLNGQFSNELLVMVDGRDVYTPTFGGVFWDVLDLPLENIERIEVIRGPGGSIWGANAVNGVVNIITKTAGETQGAMVVVGGGNLDQGFATVQYGGALGKNTNYRVYSKYFNQNHMPGLTGEDARDDWHALRGGFRADSKISAKDTLMLQGDIYTGEEGDPTTVLPSVTSPRALNAMLQTSLSGGFVQSVWNHIYSPQSDTTLSFSYDKYQRNDLLAERRGTFGVDFQNHLARVRRNDIVWGLGYRYSASHSDGSLSVFLNPANLNIQLFSSFVQDEIALVPERFSLVVGAKLEHNHYTGFTLMPNVRVSFTPSARQSLWAAISRAVRTPAETNAALHLNFAGFPGPGGIPVLIGLIGNPAFKNEGLVAYEIGYRTAILKNLSIDLASYYNRYDHQQTIEPSAPFFEGAPLPAHILMPTTYQNLMHGESHGLEMAVKWKITDRWTLSPGYAFNRIHMQTRALSQDMSTMESTDGSDPHVTAQLRSHLSLSERFDWDVSAYYVDRLVFQGVPSYTRLDTELSWRLREGLSLSVVGQNLIKDHHLEFVNESGATSALTKRSAYAKLTWQY